MYAFIVGYTIIQCSLAVCKALIFQDEHDLTTQIIFLTLQTILIVCFNLPVIFYFIRAIQIYLRVTR